jgi:hypothetical protein
MATRPKHVSSLSDKISGLKFMQRAKAVQEKKQAGPSESTSTVRLQDAERDGHEREPENGNQKDLNEEHWVLPRAKVDQLKRTASVTSTISHEPGWNAWLIDAEEGGGGATINDEEANATTTTRKVFGSWIRKGRKRKSEEADVEQDLSPEFSDNDEEEGGESDDDVVDKGKVSIAFVSSSVSFYDILTFFYRAEAQNEQRKQERDVYETGIIH